MLCVLSIRLHISGNQTWYFPVPSGISMQILNRSLTSKLTNNAAISMIDDWVNIQYTYWVNLLHFHMLYHYITVPLHEVVHNICYINILIVMVKFVLGALDLLLKTVLVSLIYQCCQTWLLARWKLPFLIKFHNRLTTGHNRVKNCARRTSVWIHIKVQ